MWSGSWRGLRARARESRIASSRRPRPPGVFCGTAIRWEYILDVIDHAEAKSEFNFGAGAGI